MIAMGITLTNTAAGGSINITLNSVMEYVQTDVTTFPVKKVPGKPTATVDTDCFTVDPRKYRIRARITTAIKTSLLSFKAQSAYQVKLTDNEQSNINVRVIEVEADAQSGYVDEPWIATITIQTETQ